MLETHCSVLVTMLFIGDDDDDDDVDDSDSSPGNNKLCTTRSMYVKHHVKNV